MQKIINIYNTQIKEINNIILKFAQGKSPLIQEISKHLISSGGKRIRPVLLLMTADLCNQDKNDVILNLAAAVEMIHSATLLHDDVVDNSKMRRNQKTANSIWDNKASILVGDYIFSVAFQLMVKSNNLKALELLAKTSSIMADGEVLQLENSNNIKISFEQYLDIIYGKTAILFSSACAVPALISSKKEEEFLSLKEFGKNLGLIFQMVDDVLDYSAKEQNIGKEIGSDFFEGKVTLPLITLYKKSSHIDQKIINQIHQDNLISPKKEQNLKQIMQLINKYDVLNDCQNTIKQYQSKAIKTLEIFKNNEIKERILSILDYSTTRLN